METEKTILFNRAWAMPSRHTFTIKPIAELLKRYVTDGSGVWIDPFCGENSPAQIRNDLNGSIQQAQTHLPAVEFIEKLERGGFSNVLLDPPYSPRQVTECYAGIGIKATAFDTSSGLYANVRRLLPDKMLVGGLAISFGWNSCGLGKKAGFEIQEILLVSHGGGHNDTIVTVERRVSHGGG